MRSCREGVARQSLGQVKVNGGAGLKQVVLEASMCVLYICGSGVTKCEIICPSAVSLRPHALVPDSPLWDCRFMK